METGIVNKPCVDPHKLCGDARIYHVKQALTDKWIESNTPGINEMGSVCATLAAMPGVTQVYVQRYSAQIHKGKAFTWEEVEEKLLPFLQVFM